MFSLIFVIIELQSSYFFIEKIKLKELEKRLTEREKGKIDALQEMYEREYEKKHGIRTIEFKDWNDVKNLFDKKSRKIIEKALKDFKKIE